MLMVVQRLLTTLLLGVMIGLVHQDIDGSIHLNDFILEKKKILFGLN
jgi:hypothetical protein